MVSRSTTTKAFVTQQQLERFRNEVFGHMNETVENFRGLLASAEQNFGSMTQRMELMDSWTQNSVTLTKWQK